MFAFVTKANKTFAKQTLYVIANEMIVNLTILLWSFSAITKGLDNTFVITFANEINVSIVSQNIYTNYYRN